MDWKSNRQRLAKNVRKELERRTFTASLFKGASASERKQRDDFTKTVRPITQSNRTYNKVFGIGFNKTATTSLAAILRLYGLVLPDQKEQEARTVKQFLLGNYAPLREFVEKYDAFQDMPFSQNNTYVVCDVLFPNSKFILTERDPDVWFNSLCNFLLRNRDFDNLQSVTEDELIEDFRYLYAGYRHFHEQHFLTGIEDGEIITRWDKLFDRDYYINKYVQRNNEIRIYFKDRPDDLLIIDLTKEQDTTKICSFLGIPGKFKSDMPHLNKT